MIDPGYRRIRGSTVTWKNVEINSDFASKVCTQDSTSADRELSLLLFLFSNEAFHHSIGQYK